MLGDGPLVHLRRRVGFPGAPKRLQERHGSALVGRVCGETLAANLECALDLTSRQVVFGQKGVGWRTRLATCRKWLGLLQDSMPPSTFRKLNRSLNDLAGKAAGAEGQEAPKMLADHAKLDLLIAVANRQATRTIADLLPRKSN